MTFSRVVCIGVFCLGGALPAAADSGFRCGTRLIGLDDASYEVREKCGDPEAIVRRVERRVIRQTIRVRRGNVEEFTTIEREIEVPVEEWTYDFGPRAFIRYAIFENGRLANVKTGDYGKRADL